MEENINKKNMIKIGIVLAFHIQENFCPSNKYSFDIPNTIKEIDKKCNGKGKQIIKQTF